MLVIKIVQREQCWNCLCPYAVHSFAVIDLLVYQIAKNVIAKTPLDPREFRLRGLLNPVGKNLKANFLKSLADRQT
jgi:hypothetical protein